jgi:RNA polymerase sigma-70 factor (ECF subfamily)
MNSVPDSISWLCAGSVHRTDRVGVTFDYSLAADPSHVTASPPDDFELMQRIGRGDAHAYRKMVEQYLRSVTRFSERILGGHSEAEDVAQETFLRLWTEAARWTPNAQPKTWLYRIARNLCVDRLRKRKHVSDSLEQQVAADRPSGLLMRKQTALQVERALRALPERQRAAITLVHYEGLSGAEACEVLEIGLEALESLLARGRRTLREQLRELARSMGEDELARSMDEGELARSKDTRRS